ncbi:MAG TPA: hypothetical protein VKB38_08525 [Terracidiphilus sp.]|nr:hypothetical protein [Terracidiphilus sp.]
MADMHEGELELELEDEFHEGELEDEAGEGEGWLGAIGNIAGSLLGEEELEDESLLGEDEFEGEEEDEYEDEGEGEGWLGTIGNIAGSLLGEEELEDEFEFEDEGEQFSFGGFLKKALPVLKSVAKVAAPIVGGAILGPAGASLGKAVGSALGEEELEAEEEGEDEFEGEAEMVHEIGSHPMTHNEALAEMMADAASREMHEGEAEAMAGAAVMTVISPRDRRVLRRSLPHLVRATAILTRILRKRRRSRVGVKAVPTIMRRSVKTLKKHARKGLPITRARVARTVSKQVKRVLGSPKAAATAIVRNHKVARRYKSKRVRTTRRRRRLV